MAGTDLSRGWLPVTVVGSIALPIIAVVWWAAAEHADLQAVKLAVVAAETKAVAAELKASAAEARALQAENAAAAKANEVLAKLSGIEVGVMAVKAQNANIETQLAELRAAWVRGPQR